MLIPSAATNIDKAKIAAMLFSGLAYLDEKGEVKNDIAQAIIPNDNCTVYDIELTADLLFSDGTKVDAESFARTWSDAVRNVETRPEASLLTVINGYDVTSGAAPVVSTDSHRRPPAGTRENTLTPDLAGVEIVSSTRFKVHLSIPTCDFVKRLATPFFSPLPASAFDENGKISADFGENPFGYGPYMLAREGAWEHDSQLILVPNEHYRGPRRARNEGISFKFYRDAHEAYRDLQNDALDINDNLPSAALKTYKDQLGARATSGPNAVADYLVFPLDGHFAVGSEEGRLRRAAVSLCLNRVDLSKMYFAGLFESATDFVTPVVLGHTENLAGNEVLKFNVAQAKANWAAADSLAPWDGEIAMARVDNEMGEWVDGAAGQIRSCLGVRVSVKAFPDRVTLEKNVKTMRVTNPDGSVGALQLTYPAGWRAKYPGMKGYLWPNFATVGIANRVGYSNPEYDALLYQAGGTVSESEAVKLYTQAESLLIRDLPVVPLWHESVAVGWSTKVAGVQLDWQGLVQYWRVTKD
ncbi:peptide ABC transporter substrate-binding protein [Mobiluncus porci]|nr:ABC transporter substrate-binding protein [Mobiluncus porci]